jgi:membrane fusion protein (multidrug efflux system)
MSNPSEPTDASPITGSSKLRFIMSGVVTLVLLISGTIWYLGRNNESTDDAFIESDVVPIASRVGGTVLNVAVAENQMIKQGDILFYLDPKDYQLKVNQLTAMVAAGEARAAIARNDSGLVQASTKAAVTQAEAGVAAAQAMVAQVEAQRSAAESQAKLAIADVERYRTLLAKDEISRQRLDQAVTAADAAKAQAESARKAVTSAEAMVRQASGKLDEAKTAPRQIAVKESQVGSAVADLQTLQSQLASAQQDLSYTKVSAPSAGRVARKSVLLGQVMQANQTALYIVTGQPWVIANFKETQLTRMVVGQKVEVKVDAFPGQILNAHVESLQAGTGSRFSLLPPENATGNYIKVVQRIPVKIVFDEKPETLAKLAPGMSVVPIVHLDSKAE